MAKNGKGGESSKQGGIVLNISSIQALVSWPAMPAYSAAKAGIVAYTRCAGHHLEYEVHGVKIVCLCPFGVDTPMQYFERYTGMTDVGLAFLTSLDVKGAILTAEEVGQACLDVMEKGKTGSVWYIHKSGDKPYEIPDQNTWENLMKPKPTAQQ